MNERFSADAQRVLALAQEEARFLGHGTCSGEHLLLGLIRDAGSAGAALGRRGFTLDSGRAAVAAELGRGDAIRSSANLPWANSAKTALAAGLANADRSQSALVESGHLLFGVLGTKNDRLTSVLARLNAGPSDPASSAVAQFVPATPAANGTTPVPPTLEQRIDELSERVDRLAALVGDLVASDYRPSR